MSKTFPLLLSILPLLLLLSHPSTPIPVTLTFDYDPTTDSLIYNSTTKFKLTPLMSAAVKSQIPPQTSSHTTALISESPESQPIDSKAQFGTGEFWFDLFMVILLTLFAGLMSGLTVGYLSIDKEILKIKIQNTQDAKEKRKYELIFNVIDDHHWILVTLLVCNSFAMEAMPIMLNRLVNEMTAIVISVTLILFFGEIIPQALCTGENKMDIAYWMAWPTRILMWVTAPISYLLAKLIDKLVKEPMPTRFTNKELVTLIERHALKALYNNQEDNQENDQEDNQGDNQENININTDLSNSNKEMGLTDLQVKIIKGTFDLNVKSAKDIMITFDKVKMIDRKDKFDNNKLNELRDTGFSRFPIYDGEKENIVGLLLIKRLIGIKMSGKTLEEMKIKIDHPVVVGPDENALELLNLFKDGKSHMAIITKKIDQLQRNLHIDSKNESLSQTLLNKIQDDLNKDYDDLTGQIEGIVTLEDVIEHLTSIEILDENDRMLIRKISKGINMGAGLKPLKSKNIKDGDLKNFSHSMINQYGNVLYKNMIDNKPKEMVENNDPSRSPLLGDQ